MSPNRTEASIGRARGDARWLLPAERQRRIVELARQEPRRVIDLAATLAVSAMTIRRDADDLAAAGQLERVRGGVRAVQRPATEEPTPSVKSTLRPEAKLRIARAVVALVQDGSAVGIGSGTTTLEVARLLHEREHITVVTNAVPVADVLRGTRVHVVLTGGERTVSDALVGPIANRAAESLTLDVLVLGAHGIDVSHGCTTPNLQEAETDRALMRATQRTIVAADASKWGERGLATYASLEEVDVLVTDRALAPVDRAAAARRVGRLIVV